MSKIFFDVTQLVGWKGGLTGIPRTTDEIAMRLKDLPNTEFIIWNTAQRKFKTVDIHKYYEVQAPLNREYFKNIKPGDVPEVPPFGGRVTRKAKLVLGNLPVAGRYLKAANRRLKDSKAFKDANSLVTGEPNVQPGDTLFIPCGVWDDKFYIDQLLEWKHSGSKLAFIAYDILPIVVPQFSGQWGAPMKDFIKKVTAECDVVFCISEHTKNDLEAWLKDNDLKAPPMAIIRLGDEFEFNDPVVPRDKLFAKSNIQKTGEDFILCTGTIEARKNHTLLYYTYKLAKSRGIDLPKLVVVGRRGHRTENIIHIMQDDPEVNDKIMLLFDTNDQELSWLYKHCKFTIYPSFYEGWGLPIAESIANGIPCLTSNTSSMTEVAPKIADYFNPASPDDCLAAIQGYLDAKKYAKAKAKAKAYKPVQWDYTFEQVMQSLVPLGADTYDKR
jgi:glycosyltransferase involved in cell wall biosynthesis